jgi:hypothetical protein
MDTKFVQSSSSQIERANHKPARAPSNANGRKMTDLANEMDGLKHSIAINAGKLEQLRPYLHIHLGAMKNGI